MLKQIQSKVALSALALAGFAALGSVPAQADEPAAGATEMTKGEAKLAKMIDGRVAGEPRRCIANYSASRGFTVIDDTAIVVRDGRTLWVNYTKDARGLDSDDVLVFRQFGSQVCNTDVVTTIDRYGGFTTGVVFLSEFVPYRKADKEG